MALPPASPRSRHRSRRSGRRTGTEKIFRFRCDALIDATGDGFVAMQAGAPFRYGREARDEFNEAWAPEVADDVVLGSSIMFAARDIGRPIPFVPPEWAHSFPDEESLPYRTLSLIHISEPTRRTP